MKRLAIEIEGVSVRYRLAKEKPKTLQEYVIQRLKGRKMDYEAFWAIRGVTIHVTKGETLGIIGHNGAGKSTLLKIIAGVLKPTEGLVTVNGKIAPLIEISAGFDMELTGVENIFLNASMLGLSRKEIESRIDPIVDFSELHEFIHSPLRSYSSGMIARLGFSIATAVDPDILIIDESLSVGDERFRRKFDMRIDELKMRGTTLLLVSHMMGDIERLCDKILWLDHGRLKAYSSDVEEVIKSYTA